MGEHEPMTTVVPTSLHHKENYILPRRPIIRQHHVQDDIETLCHCDTAVTFLLYHFRVNCPFN